MICEKCYDFISQKKTKQKSYDGKKLPRKWSDDQSFNIIIFKFYLKTCSTNIFQRITLALATFPNSFSMILISIFQFCIFVYLSDKFDNVCYQRAAWRISFKLHESNKRNKISYNYFFLLFLHKTASLITIFEICM